jgi:hypothetical protein
MRVSTKLGSLTLALLFAGELIHAELYHVTVSREAQDLYRVDYNPRDVYVKTRYCYVYCYFEEARIDTDRMEIHFLDSDDECDIDKILSE